MKTGFAVEIIEGCDSNNVPQRIIQSTEPILLKGLVSSWQLVEQAKKDPLEALSTIRSHYTGRPVWSFMSSPEARGRYFYNDDLTGFNFEKAQVDLNDILDRLIEYQYNQLSPSYYVGSTAMDSWLPGLSERNKLDLDQFSPINSIWLGNRSTIAAHYDFPANIACCVAGKRRFTLFPPAQLSNLYVGPIDFTPAGQQISLVDFDEPDFDRFPRFELAMSVAKVIDLEPGDAILIPSMWWHHVRATESINVLINYWWRNSPAYYGAPNEAFLHALLAIKNLPTEQRAAMKTMFDAFVFDQPAGTLEHFPDHAHGRLGEVNEDMARQIRAELLMKLKR